MINAVHDGLPKDLLGIVFDCDGVMIDSIEANRHFYNTILASLGLPPMTTEQEAYAFMATAKQALQTLTPEEYHDKIEDIIKTVIDYTRDILPKTKLMPGFREFYEEAHSRGLKLGIDTNRTDFGIDAVLDFFHLPQYFKPVISSTIASPKPDPAGLLLIVEAWDAKPRQVLFIGDSEDDMLAARRAKTLFAAFGPNNISGFIRAMNFTDLGNQLWPMLQSRRT